MERMLLLAGCCNVSLVYSQTLSWLLGYRDTHEHFMNSSRFLVVQAPSSFSTIISSEKRKRENPAYYEDPFWCSNTVSTSKNGQFTMCLPSMAGVIVIRPF
jgi:hypothetical protein